MGHVRRVCLLHLLKLLRHCVLVRVELGVGWDLANHMMLMLGDLGWNLVHLGSWGEVTLYWRCGHHWIIIRFQITPHLSKGREVSTLTRG